MKSNTAVEAAEKLISEKEAWAAELKNKGLLDLGRAVMNEAYFAEDVLRTMGFTVKTLGREGVEIKCKWSDAPEALKNGR